MIVGGAVEDTLSEVTSSPSIIDCSISGYGHGIVAVTLPDVENGAAIIVVLHSDIVRVLVVVGMLLGTHRHLLLSFLCVTAGSPGFCVPSTYYMSWHRLIFASHDEKNKKIFGCGISHPKKE